MPSAISETEDEGGDPAFDRLVRIYEYLGLDPDPAGAAAGADLDCGWDAGGFPADLK